MAWRAGDQSSKPEMVVAGSEWSSATDGDRSKGELVVSFDACVTRLLCESASVGRHDARIATCCSLADLFDTADFVRGTAAFVFTGRLENPYNAEWSATVYLVSAHRRVWVTVFLPFRHHLVSLLRRVWTTVFLLCRRCQNRMELESLQWRRKNAGSAVYDSIPLIMTPCPICRKNEVGLPESLDESMVAAEVNWDMLCWIALTAFILCLCMDTCNDTFFLWVNLFLCTLICCCSGHKEFESSQSH